MKFFSRRKSLEDIANDIIKEVKDLSLNEANAVLCAVLSKIIESNKDKIEVQYLFDTSILKLLLSIYNPEDTMKHLAYITKRLIDEYPDLGEILKHSTEVPNGVV